MKKYCSPELIFKYFKIEDVLSASDEGIFEDVFGSGDSSNSELW